MSRILYDFPIDKNIIIMQNLGFLTLGNYFGLSYNKKAINKIMSVKKSKIIPISEILNRK